MRRSLCLAVFLFGSTIRANPTDELLRLVPEEATVCFIAQDLRSHSARVAGSPFAEWLNSSPWGKGIAASDDWKKFEAAQQAMGQTLGVKPGDLRDDIFGDAVVYAYLPGAAGNRADDAGVLFAQARDPKLLAKLAATLNDNQTKSGEVLNVSERSHSGQTYFAREKPEGRADYYRIDGGLLIYSTRERPMKLALEGKAKAPNAGGAAPTFAAARKQLGFESAALAALFAPRSIDAELKAVGQLLPGDNAKAFVKRFAEFWAAVDAIGLALDIDKGVQISLGFVADRKRIEGEWKTFLTPSLPSAVWSAVPADALFAVCGQFHWNELSGLGRTFVGETGRAKFQQWMDQNLAPVVGRELLPLVLERIGPDWGGWLAPPAKDAGTHFPVAVVSLRLPPAVSPEVKVRSAVKAAFDFFVQSYRVDYNKKHDDQWRIEESTSGAGNFTTLTNERVLPEGVRPTFGLRGDYLVLGTAPKALSEFPESLEANAEHAGLLLRFSATRTAKYLNDHGKELAAGLAKQSGRDAGELQREFAALASVLEMFESWELRHTAAGNLTKFTMRIEFTKPLK